MQKSQHDGLRQWTRTLQGQDDLGIRTREQLAKLSWVLSAQHCEISIIPFFQRSCGRGCLSFLRWRRWRWCQRMRRLRGCDSGREPLSMYASRLRLLWDSLGIIGRGLTDGRLTEVALIHLIALNILSTGAGRTWVLLMLRLLMLWLLMLLMMRRRTSNIRRIHGQELHLVREHTDGVFQVTNQ
jgi:hypothetical protein